MKRFKHSETWWINKCKLDITYKYFYNKESYFKHSDFKRLSEEIYNISNISIGISTLARIFNDNYLSIPHLTTLDAFAKYLGYENWNEYKRSFLNNGNTDKTLKSIFFVSKKKLLIITTGILIVSSAIALFTYLYTGSQKKKALKNIEFSYCDFNSDEMPVTVFFKYNLNGIKCDSATIQPLGRATSKYGDEFRINPNGSLASYTYLWPDAFNPKLTIDGKVVKQLILRLKTGTWKAAVSNMKDIFYIKYFNDGEVFESGIMGITEKILNQNNFPKSDVEQTSYHLFKDFENITGDSIQFTTRIKNNVITRKEKSGSAIISLIFENDELGIPISIDKSPFEELYLEVFNKYFSTKTTDLSFLYTNLEKWNKFRIKTFDKQFELFINDSLVFQTGYEIYPGKLYGIRYLFNGLGEIDYVRFYNSNDSLVYNDEFE